MGTYFDSYLWIFAAHYIDLMLFRALAYVEQILYQQQTGRNGLKLWKTTFNDLFENRN